MVPLSNHTYFTSAGRGNLATCIFNDYINDYTILNCNVHFIVMHMTLSYRRENMDPSTINESDVGPHQQTPPNDDITVHHTADTDEQLQSSQQQTDIDLQLQNWNFHTVIVTSSKLYMNIIIVANLTPIDVDGYCSRCLHY